MSIQGVAVKRFWIAERYTPTQQTFMDGLQKLRKRGKNEILAETRENERSICIYELVATCLCLVATCLCFSRYVFVFSCYEFVI